MEKNDPRKIRIKTLVYSVIFCILAFDAISAEENSVIRFSVNQIGGIVVEGEIPEFSGNICFEKNKPESVKAAITLNMASATTGVVERDQIIQAPEWLSTEMYPKGYFVLENLTETEASGTLTLKGKNKVISFPLTIDPLSGQANGNLTIDRRDFNIGEGRWGETEKWVGFEIRISFNIVADPNGGSCDE